MQVFWWMRDNRELKYGSYLGSRMEEREQFQAETLSKGYYSLKSESLQFQFIADLIYFMRGHKYYAYTFETIQFPVRS